MKLKTLFRKIRGSIEAPFNKQFKKCKCCGRPFNKTEWSPIIVSYDNNALEDYCKKVDSNAVYIFTGRDNSIIPTDYFKILYCLDCWNDLSVEDKIKNYIKNLKPSQDKKFIIKQICEKSNVNPIKFLRKIKLNEIERR